MFVRRTRFRTSLHGTGQNITQARQKAIDCTSHACLLLLYFCGTTAAALSKSGRKKEEEETGEGDVLSSIWYI